MNAILRAVIVNRLREPSTYLGLIFVIGGALGYQLRDDLAAEIAGAFAVIVGAILAAHRERKSPDHPSNRPAPPPFTSVDAAPPTGASPAPGPNPEPPSRLGPGGARERFLKRQRDEHEDGGP